MSKPKERRKKEETFEAYTTRCKSEFLELEFSFDQLQIDEVIEQYDRAREEIIAKKEEKEFLQNKMACLEFHQSCPYYSQCHGKTYTLASGKW